MKKTVKMVSVGSYASKYESGEIFLPSFQSGERWKDDRRIAYIKALLNDSITPPIYIGEKGELLEGQQRSTAIKMAIASKLGFTVEQITALKAKKLDIYYLSDYTMQELAEWYIAINNGGVSHNKLEIAKAKLTSDDSIGFAELESHNLWSKLPVKSEREGIKAILMQALLLIESPDCAVDIGASNQQKLLEHIAKNNHVATLEKLVSAVEYTDKALLHSQKWLKKGMVAFILCLAVEAIEQEDSPAIFGGFLQSFYNGKLTVMTGKKANIPVISSEHWSTLTSGSGTSKPQAVQIRWNMLFNAYSTNISDVPEYIEPAYIREANQAIAKKAEQEKDRELYRQFMAWKEAQEIMAQEQKQEVELTADLLEV